MVIVEHEFARRRKPSAKGGLAGANETADLGINSPGKPGDLRGRRGRRGSREPCATAAFSSPPSRLAIRTDTPNRSSPSAAHRVQMRLDRCTVSRKARTQKRAPVPCRTGALHAFQGWWEWGVGASPPSDIRERASDQSPSPSRAAPHAQPCAPSAPRLHMQAISRSRSHAPSHGILCRRLRVRAPGVLAHPLAHAPPPFPSPAPNCFANHASHFGASVPAVASAWSPYR